MIECAIYLRGKLGSDPFILKGLQEAGCVVQECDAVLDALQHILELCKLYRQAGDKQLPLVVAADVDAGAISLLTLLREQLDREIAGLPVLVFDRLATDIRIAIRMLQLGAREYVLGSLPEVQREMAAQVFVERLNAKPMCGGASPVGARRDGKGADAILENVLAGGTGDSASFHWDPVTNFISCGDNVVRLSRSEARIFDQLLKHRGDLVSAQELVDKALPMSTSDEFDKIYLLRLYIMRLRRKLARYPCMSFNLINVRAKGYMLV